MLLMLGAAWVGGNVFVLRPVNTLLGAVQRLRAGDLGARAGLSAGVDESASSRRPSTRWPPPLEQRTGENKEKERRIARLNRVYAMLSRINSAIIRLRVRTELLQETCRIAVEEGPLPPGLDRLWPTPQSGELVPLCHAGDESGLPRTGAPLAQGGRGGRTRRRAAARRTDRGLQRHRA